MISDAYPVRWTGQQAVVPLPEYIGLSNAALIREELLSVINRGATTLISDMTATISCDHAGADAVARAFQRAVISGTELRLVVTAQIVRRVRTLNGLDRLVSIYPSLEAATAARPPAPVLALVAKVPGTEPTATRRPAVPEGRRPSSRQRTGTVQPSPWRWCGSWSTPSRTGWHWPTTTARSHWPTCG
jgi:anti-anti-sigma regulatory factor